MTKRRPQAVGARATATTGNVEPATGRSWAAKFCPSPAAGASLPVAALAVGGMIYLAKRPKTLVMFEWVESMGVGGCLDLLRAGVNRVPVYDWVLFSLPQALWGASLVITVRLIWTSQPGAARLLAVGASVGMALFAEIGQALGIVPGIFDLVDLAVLGASIATALAWPIAEDRACQL